MQKQKAGRSTKTLPSQLKLTEAAEADKCACSHRSMSLSKNKKGPSGMLSSHKQQLDDSPESSAPLPLPPASAPVAAYQAAARQYAQPQYQAPPYQQQLVGGLPAAPYPYQQPASYQQPQCQGHQASGLSGYGGFSGGYGDMGMIGVYEGSGGYGGMGYGGMPSNMPISGGWQHNPQEAQQSHPDNQNHQGNAGYSGSHGNHFSPNYMQPYTYANMYGNHMGTQMWSMDGMGMGGMGILHQPAAFGQQQRGLTSSMGSFSGQMNHSRYPNVPNMYSAAPSRRQQQRKF